MGLEIQGAVNSMIGSARQIQEQNNDTARKALSIALGAVGGAATGGAPGALAGAAKSAASQAGISGSDTLSQGVKGMASGEGFMGGIRKAEQARLQAMQSMQNAQQEKTFGRKEIVEAYQKMPKKDQRWAAHDINKLRGGNNGTK